MNMTNQRAAIYFCKICNYATDHPDPAAIGIAPGNTIRFFTTQNHLWQCPCCKSIHNIDSVDFADIYKDYPLLNRRLDIFAQWTLRNLLGRLKAHGLKYTDSILDYGCGNGIFLKFLKQSGYQNVDGYDPFIPGFDSLPEKGKTFDCVVVNDTVEHVPDPRATIKECADFVCPNGLLYIGTAESDGVRDMTNLSKHLMRLHQPFHRVILSRKALIDLAKETQFKILRTYKRSYMDTICPFANYRFLDEFNGALKHKIDDALNPESQKILFLKPKLFFYAFFGYFFPSAYEPAVLLRKPHNRSEV